MRYCNAIDWHDKDREWKDSNPYIVEDGKRIKLTYQQKLDDAGNIVNIYAPTLKTLSAAELTHMDLKPVEHIVEGILPVGLGLLCAPSKMGKSWLCLDLALSVCSGTKAMGFDTHKGGVLYLALEDSWNRLQDRINKVLCGRDVPNNLHIALECQLVNKENQHSGLAGQIEQHMELHPDTRLVIIDTLAMVNGGRGKLDAYEHFYKFMQPLKRLSVEKNICILFVHHTRKGNGFDADPFDDILGSTALQGATDFMIVLKRKADNTFLYTRGRDIEAMELAVEFEGYRWRNLGTIDEIEEIEAQFQYESSPIIRTIKQRLAEIEADKEEPIKQYVITASDFQIDVASVGGEFIGSSAKEFANIARRFDSMLRLDGIAHEEPDKQTTYKGKTGKFHRYYHIR